MHRYCSFDRLPVEVLHCIFTYFWADEILFTFSDISDCVDSVLLTYPTYQVKFRSIQKDHFDLICERIAPEQIISLVLSDEHDTPCQSELFFSRFQIEQFTHLQTLALFNIESQSFKWIFPNLPKLNSLRSLIVVNSSIRSQYQHEMTDTHPHMYDSFRQVLPHLHRLQLTDGIILSSIPLPSLRDLKLDECSKNELKTLSQYSTQLRSLSVCLNIHRSTFDQILFPVQLIRLALKTESEPRDRYISMKEMEHILSVLPNLKHLKLELHGLEDLFDGSQWQIVIHPLITFHFKFHSQGVLNVNSIESYRTPFWLEEKHWFVGCDDYSIFSIPHFAPVCLDMSQHMNFNSTALNSTLLYSRVNAITLGQNQIQSENRFTTVNRQIEGDYRYLYQA